jgi:hypothetical protein
LAFGTLVQDGRGSLKAIETFVVGDNIMAAGKDLHWSPEPVVYSGGTSSASQQDSMVMIQYAGTAIVVTVDHLFLLADKPAQLRRADRLTTRDKLVSPTGESIPITGVHVGHYSGGIHHVVATSKELPSDNLDGHLLNTNGVVSADYAVQLMSQSEENAENIGGFDLTKNFELPIVGSVDYIAKFGAACLQIPEKIVKEIAKSLKGAPGIGAVSAGAGNLADLVKAFTPLGATTPRIPDNAHSFLDSAEGQARKSSPKRPFNDPVTRESVKYLIQQYQLHYSDITFHVNWTGDEVNAYAWSANGARHVCLQSGLVRDNHLGLEGIALVLAHQVASNNNESPDFTDYLAVCEVMRRVWFGGQYETMTERAIRQIENFFNAAPASHDASRTDTRPPARRLALYRSAVTLSGVPAAQ